MVAVTVETQTTLHIITTNVIMRKPRTPRHKKRSRVDFTSLLPRTYFYHLAKGSKSLVRFPTGNLVNDIHFFILSAKSYPKSYGNTTRTFTSKRPHAKPRRSNSSYPFTTSRARPRHAQGFVAHSICPKRPSHPFSISVPLPISPELLSCLIHPPYLTSTPSPQPLPNCLHPSFPLSLHLTPPAPHLPSPPHHPTHAPN